VLLIVDPHPVLGLREGHGGILAAHGFALKVSHLTAVQAIKYF